MANSDKFYFLDQMYVHHIVIYLRTYIFYIQNLCGHIPGLDQVQLESRFPSDYVYALKCCIIYAHSNNNVMVIYM